SLARLGGAISISLRPFETERPPPRSIGRSSRSGADRWKSRLRRQLTAIFALGRATFLQRFSKIVQQMKLGKSWFCIALGLPALARPGGAECFVLTPLGSKQRGAVPLPQRSAR